MRPILLLGCRGQVGWELERALTPLGKLHSFCHSTLDITDKKRVASAIMSIQPQVIVNAAAYTDVEGAEKEAEKALAINATAPLHLAQQAKKIGALLIHYSTDYVFDGLWQGAYSEEQTANPLNKYGETKLLGEQAIESVGGNYLILRCSWVYGNRGVNFMNKIFQLAERHSWLEIVCDQQGAPTWSRLIAETTALMILLKSRLESTLRSGTYHVSCSGCCSWHQFAEKSLHLWRQMSGLQGGGVAHLHPVSSVAYRSEAKSRVIRPANSLLDCAKLREEFGLALPDWEEALKLCLQERLIS